MSEANRVSIIFADEGANYGQAPSGTAFETVRFTGANLAANPQTQISNEIRNDRMVIDLVKVGEQVGGNINFELAQGDAFDALLEAAFMGTWDSTTGVLTPGTTERSFAFEMAFNDWTVVQYLQFLGMRVDTFALSAAHGQIVTGSFGLVGASVAQASGAANSLADGETVNAASTTEVMEGSSDVSLLEVDGTDTYIVRAVNLNLTNNMRAILGMGTAGARDQSAGRSVLTGSVEMYFDSIAQYNKLINNQTAQLEMTLTDGSNSYAFNMPKVKWQDGAPVPEAIDTDVMLNMNFTAIYDSGIGAQVQVTRT